MEDAIDVVQDGPEFGAVAHIATGEKHVFVQGRRVAGAQVIENSHLVAHFHQAVGQCGANEAGASGDQYSHVVIPSLVGDV